MNKYFEIKKLHNNTVEERYIIKEDAPKWVTELVRECHGSSMPIDCIYEIVSDCIDQLSEFNTHEKSYDACLNQANLTYTSDIARQFNDLLFVIDELWNDLADMVHIDCGCSPIEYITTIVPTYHSWILDRCRDVMRTNNFWNESEE